MKLFDSVASLKLARLKEGQLVVTKSYYANDNSGSGSATYKILTAAQASSDGYTIDEYGNHTLANGNVAILQNEDYANVVQYGAIQNGAAIETDLFNAAIGFNGIVKIPHGVEVLVDDIDLDLKKLFGGGKLSYTTISAFPGDTYNFNNDIVFDGITIECRNRNRLQLESNNITCINVVEKLNTSDTAAGQYTNVNWQGTQTISITGHRTIDTGLKITETGRLTITGALIEVNNAGLGVGNGIDDGTDGLKISTGSGNIQNLVVRGCSRDVIDGFVSSGSDDNILIGNISNGSNTFPTATGAEQFAHNIVV